MSEFRRPPDNSGFESPDDSTGADSSAYGQGFGLFPDADQAKQADYGDDHALIPDMPEVAPPEVNPKPQEHDDQQRPSVPDSPKAAPEEPDDLNGIWGWSFESDDADGPKNQQPAQKDAQQAELRSKNQSDNTSETPNETAPDEKRSETDSKADKVTGGNDKPEVDDTNVVRMDVWRQRQADSRRPDRENALQANREGEGQSDNESGTPSDQPEKHTPEKQALLEAYWNAEATWENALADYREAKAELDAIPEGKQSEKLRKLVEQKERIREEADQAYTASLERLKPHPDSSGSRLNETASHEAQTETDQQQPTPEPPVPVDKDDAAPAKPEQTSPEQDELHGFSHRSHGLAHGDRPNSHRPDQEKPQPADPGSEKQNDKASDIPSDEPDIKTAFDQLLAASWDTPDGQIILDKEDEERYGTIRERYGRPNEKQEELWRAYQRAKQVYQDAERKLAEAQLDAKGQAKQDPEQENRLVEEAGQAVIDATPAYLDAIAQLDPEAAKLVSNDTTPENEQAKDVSTANETVRDDKPSSDVTKADATHHNLEAAKKQYTDAMDEYSRTVAEAPDTDHPESIEEEIADAYYEDGLRRAGEEASDATESYDGALTDKENELSDEPEAAQPDPWEAYRKAKDAHEKAQADHEAATLAAAAQAEPSDAQLEQVRKTEQELEAAQEAYIATVKQLHPSARNEAAPDEVQPEDDPTADATSERDSDPEAPDYPDNPYMNLLEADEALSEASQEYFGNLKDISDFEGSAGTVDDEAAELAEALQAYEDAKDAHARFLAENNLPTIETPGRARPDAVTKGEQPDEDTTAFDGADEGDDETYELSEEDNDGIQELDDVILKAFEGVEFRIDTDDDSEQKPEEEFKFRRKRAFDEIAGTDVEVTEYRRLMELNGADNHVIRVEWNDEISYQFNLPSRRIFRSDNEVISEVAEWDQAMAGIKQALRAIVDTES